MANKNYSSTKGDMVSKDMCYEGEKGPSAERDTTGAFGTRPEVNKMSGTGAATPDQATYSVPRDNWRSK